MLFRKRNVCVWDTLLPISKALIAAPACHPAGATAVAFSSTHQLLITGGTGGALSIFDMRQRRILHTISNAHETPIKTLALHPSGDCVLSGSAGGDVKIWSLPIFREVAFMSKVHVKPSFLGDAATNFLGDAASNVAINVVRAN
jgi:WD40 repeat protein